MKSGKAKKEPNLNLLSELQWVTVTCLFLSSQPKRLTVGCTSPKYQHFHWGT